MVEFFRKHPYVFAFIELIVLVAVVPLARRLVYDAWRDRDARLRRQLSLSAVFLLFLGIAAYINYLGLPIFLAPQRPSVASPDLFKMELEFLFSDQPVLSDERRGLLEERFEFAHYLQRREGDKDSLQLALIKLKDLDSGNPSGVHLESNLYFATVKNNIALVYLQQGRVWLDIEMQIEAAVDLARSRPREIEDFIDENRVRLMDLRRGD